MMLLLVSPWMSDIIDVITYANEPQMWGLKICRIGSGPRE